MKRALIITCNDSYDYGTRTKYVEKVLLDQGYRVEHLISDFDHRNKKAYIAPHPGVIHYIHVPPYLKNMSFQRIWSHIRFGQQAKDFVMDGEYDLIYHCAPPNFTIMELSKCKRQRNFCLITEIGDMWPESIPVGVCLKKSLKIPFSIWSEMRDKYLYNSDIIIAECDLFRDKLKKNTAIEQIQTLYFCKEFIGNERVVSYKPGDEVILCYLGSINNIIDIDMIKKVLEYICKRTAVTLHIIGEGEKRRELIDAVKSAGAHVEFHGVLFDEQKKIEIFNQCHYALNIMKPEVFIGMTMKSLDYFSAGIPIINNIRGDIWEMVLRETIGFNISEKTIEQIANAIYELTPQMYNQMNASVRRTYNCFFSVDSFEHGLIKAINHCL